VLLMPLFSLTLLGDLFFKTPPLCSLRPCSGFVTKSDPFSLISVLPLPFLQDSLSLLSTPLFRVCPHVRFPFLWSLHLFLTPPLCWLCPFSKAPQFSTDYFPPLFAGYTPPCFNVPPSLPPYAPVPRPLLSLLSTPLFPCLPLLSASYAPVTKPPLSLLPMPLFPDPDHVSIFDSKFETTNPSDY
jgi:hypothetical protein